MKKLLPTLFASCLVSPFSLAADKHVHGEAELFVAIEGKQVLIELISPADNLLGFEHKPKTNEQKVLLENTLKQLQQVEQIAVISEGNCTQADVFIESPFGEAEAHAKHDHGHHKEHESHKGGEHDHAHEDKHDHHGHGHSDAKSADKLDTHSDFHATYTLNCENTGLVSSIKASLFEHFQGFEKLHLKWVKGDAQGSARLTSAAPSTLFK